MKIEIKSWLNGSVLFSVETENWRLAVEAAVKARAYLESADLEGADLEGAYLKGANLKGAKGIDKFPIQILGHKHFLQTTQDGSLRIGCEERSFEEWLAEGFAEKIGKENGYSDTDVELYKLHIQHMQRSSQLLWKKK